MDNRGRFRAYDETTTDPSPANSGHSASNESIASQFGETNPRPVIPVDSTRASTTLEYRLKRAAHHDGAYTNRQTEGFGAITCILAAMRDAGVEKILGGKRYGGTQNTSCRR